MLKVLLINPPQKYFSESQDFNLYFPVGLLSIAAMVKDICEVKILDCLVTDFTSKTIKDCTLYGTPYEKIEEFIKNYNPDIVGISIPFSAQEEISVIISKICRKINPEMTIVIGGPHASIKYEYLLKNNLGDYCIAGEGEKSFCEFIKSYPDISKISTINGLAYKADNQIYFNPVKYIDDLDALPLPSYDLINFDDYLNSPYLYEGRSTIPKKSISVITSRGCPYNCVFCSIKLHMGKKYRSNSPEYVLRHLKLIIEKYGITNFHFEDDNVSLNKKRFEKMLDLIISENLNISWDTPNGIRADSLDINLLDKIRKSGCKQLSLPVESGNQEVLDKIIRKNSSLTHVLKIIKHANKLGIRLGAYYVIGFPGETKENMKETVDLALKMNRLYDVGISLLLATPLYGTELYDICIEQGIITKDISAKELSCATQAFGNPLISTKDFSKQDIIELTDYFDSELNKIYMRKRMVFYLKNPVEILKKIKRTLFKGNCSISCGYW